MMNPGPRAGCASFRADAPTRRLHSGWMASPRPRRRTHYEPAKTAAGSGIDATHYKIELRHLV
jgi:hypothetical protein